MGFKGYQQTACATSYQRFILDDHHITYLLFTVKYVKKVRHVISNNETFL